MKIVRCCQRFIFLLNTQLKKAKIQLLWCNFYVYDDREAY